MDAPAMSSFVREQRRVPWLVASVAILGGVTLVELVEFCRLYFAPTLVVGERLLLSLLVVARIGASFRSARRLRLSIEALWLAFPAALLALATPVLIHSAALAMYAFLLLAGSVVWLAGGRVIARQAAVMLFGLAVMVYAPGVFMAPIGALLLQAAIASSAAISSVLYPDVVFEPAAAVIRGETVRFVQACAGLELMMTLAALTLIVGAGRLRSWRFIGAVVLVGGLAFLLNNARIITIIGLANAGFRELALGSGHLPLGHAFILVGVLAILWSSEQPRGGRPSAERSAGVMPKERPRSGRWQRMRPKLIKAAGAADRRPAS
jgi:exosortase/archaeosortase family protein